MYSAFCITLTASCLWHLPKLADSLSYVLLIIWLSRTAAVNIECTWTFNWSSMYVQVVVYIVRSCTWSPNILSYAIALTTLPTNRCTGIKDSLGGERIWYDCSSCCKLPRATMNDEVKVWIIWYTLKSAGELDVLLHNYCCCSCVTIHVPWLFLVSSIASRVTITQHHCYCRLLSTIIHTFNPTLQHKAS